MKWIKFGFIMMVMTWVSAEEQKSFYEEKAVTVMNQFIVIVQKESFENAAKKVVPLIHKSLLTSNGKSLDDDTYRFSFKKAYNNAKNYIYPIKITRIQKLKTTEIGYGKRYQKGIEYKFWIAKKEGVSGLPAPLVLFFPENTELAKLSYIGSL